MPASAHSTAYRGLSSTRTEAPTSLRAPASLRDQPHTLKKCDAGTPQQVHLPDGQACASCEESAPADLRLCLGLALQRPVVAKVHLRKHAWKVPLYPLQRGSPNAVLPRSHHHQVARCRQALQAVERACAPALLGQGCDQAGRRSRVCSPRAAAAQRTGDGQDAHSKVV